MVKNSFNNFFKRHLIVPFVFVALFVCGMLANFSFTTINILSQNGLTSYAYSSQSGEDDYYNYSSSTYMGSLPTQSKNTILSTSPAYVSLSGADNLPAEYSLYGIDRILSNFTDKTSCANLKQNVGNQRGTEICWAYASLTALESTIYKSGLTSANETLNFSELNLAYVSQVANRGNGAISGGTFDMAYEYLSSEYGPVNEGTNESYYYGNASNWTSNTNATSYYANNFYSNAQKSNYRVLEAFSYPSKNSLTTSEAKLELRNSIKNHIYTYGAVTASIYMSNTYLSTYSNYTYICPEQTAQQNHMITLVGWDDDYSYNYGSTTYTGAYIAQNSYGSSWGDMNGCFYIMYEDALVEQDVNGFVRVANALTNDLSYNNMSGAEKENQFVTFVENVGTSYSARTISSDYYVANIYKRKDVDNQYISRLKIPTVSFDKETSFYVYVVDGFTYEEINTQLKLTNTLKSKFNTSLTPIVNKNATGSDKNLFTSNQTSYYTIELNNTISISGEYFAVFVCYKSGYLFYCDNASEASSPITSPYQFTYCSTTLSSWSPYCVLTKISSGAYTNNPDVKCVLPMIVQTQYELGEIDYLAVDYNNNYDGQYHNLPLTVSAPSNYVVYYSQTGEDNDWQTSSPAFKDVGTYIIYFKIKADFYETVLSNAKIVITKKDILVTPISGNGKVYGTTDPTSLSYNATGYYEEPSFTGRLARAAGEDVGMYVFTKGTLALKSNSNFDSKNYNLTFNFSSSVFEIVARDLIVTPDYTHKIYGENDVGIGYTYENQFNDEVPAFTGLLQRTSGEDVGIYNVENKNLTLVDNLSTGFKASNYNLVLYRYAGKYEILKRDLIITPDNNFTKVYLEQDPVFTFTYSNAVTGETPNFENALSRETGEDVGQYKINLGNLSLVDNNTFLARNYNLKLNTTPVYFVITYGTLQDCDLQDKTVNYNGANAYLSPTAPEGTTYEYSVNNIDWSSTAIGYKDVGSYTIYVKFNKTNYQPVYKTALLKIDPIALIVTPKLNQQKTYGQLDTQLLIDYSGFVVGETPAFTGNINRASGEDVGEYEYNVGSLSLSDNGTFKSQNYTLSFNNSAENKFLITKYNIIITPEKNQFKVYGNQDETLKFSYNYLQQETPVFQGNLIREDGEDVNSYKISLGTLSLVSGENFNKDNYTLTLNVVDVYFNIVKADITLKVVDVSSYFGEPIITNFNVDISGLYKSGDELNLIYHCDVKENSRKGQYPIYLQATNNNYNITIVRGTYSVLYKTYAVTFEVLGQIKSVAYVEHFSTVLASEVPVVDVFGYTFNNWKIVYSDTSYSIVNPVQYAVSKDITFVADMNLTLYHITYVAPDANFVTSIRSFTILTDTFYLETPTRTGYEFTGWYLNEDCTGEVVDKIEKGTSEDITLYAGWQILRYTAQVEPVDNDVATVAISGDSTVNYGSTINFSVNLSSKYDKSYNTLKVYINWQNTFEKEEATKISSTQYKVENVKDNFTISLENISINTYVITFVADENVVKTITKNYGEDLTQAELPEIPMVNKENYSDTAPYWDKTSISNITADETISAVYVPNVYEVIFVMEDGSKITTSVVYGQSVSDEVLRQNYNLNMFEYFIFDSSLSGISSNTVINVRIGSNAYILYIVLGSLTAILALTITLVVVNHKKHSKFKWWAYADEKTNKKSK